MSNPYVSVIWIEFKNTLVFSESVALKEGDDFQYQDVSSTVQNVQTTFDPLYFFNEETLVTSKFNNKMIQTIPTILTGFGPLFTFMKIAIAFGMIDFSSPEKTINSVAAFMQGMQAAAFVSVVAVSSSLIYLLVEKGLFQILCKRPLGQIQNMVGELFASISSEKFLYELLRESKVQNNSAANLIEKIPKQFKSAFNETMAANLVPYLENMIFGLNQLNKQMKEVAKGSGGKDEVDGLF
jgi:ABC-type proline/glycine betaine transport system permease subunit